MVRIYLLIMALVLSVPQFASAYYFQAYTGYQTGSNWMTTDPALHTLSAGSSAANFWQVDDVQSTIMGQFQILHDTPGTPTHTVNVAFTITASVDGEYESISGGVHDHWNYTSHGFIADSSTTRLAEARVWGSDDGDESPPTFHYLDTDTGVLQLLTNTLYDLTSFTHIGCFLEPESMLNFVASNSIQLEALSPTPVPGAVWLLGTGLVGLIGLRRKFFST